MLSTLKPDTNKQTKKGKSDLKYAVGHTWRGFVKTTDHFNSIESSAKDNRDLYINMYICIYTNAEAHNHFPCEGKRDHYSIKIGRDR